MRNRSFLLFFLFVPYGFLCGITPTWGAITFTGDVTPTPPAVSGSVNGTLTVAQGVNAGDVTLGTMTINAKSILSDTDGVVATRRGAIGQVDIDDGQWNHTDDLTIGVGGLGTVNLTNRASMLVGDDLIIGNDLSGRGILRLEGNLTRLQNTDLITVGLAGIGEIELRNRAITTSVRGLIGQNPGSQGTVQLGSESRWINTGDLTIGAAGAARLEVLGGAFVENQNGFAATAATSIADVVVSGSSSTWLNRGTLAAGATGAANLNIRDGGLIQVATELNLGSRGRVELSGGNLVANTIVSQGIIEGNGRVSGPLDNQATGEVRVGLLDHLRLTHTATNGGGMQVLGGTLEFDLAATNATAGQIAGRNAHLIFRGGLTNNGELAISSGDSDISGTVTNASTGIINVAGRSTATFYDPVANAGQIHVQSDARAVFLGRAALAATSQLSIVAPPIPAEGEPAAEEPAEFAQSLALTGSLNILTTELDNTPLARGEFNSTPLLSADALTGSFTEVRVDGTILKKDFSLPRGFRGLDRNPDAPRGLFRTLDLGGQSIGMTSYLAIPGDADGNRGVEFADFLILSAYFGLRGEWINGNFNEDDIVSFPDFLLLSDSFGKSVAAVAATGAVAVPEPNQGWLPLLLGLVWLAPRMATRAVGTAARSRFRVSRKNGSSCSLVRFPNT